MKKILCLLIFVLLFTSLVGCDVENYKVESVEYKTILPQIESTDSYDVIDVTKDEVFVVHYKQECNLSKTIVESDNKKEEIDSDVCSNYTYKIYSINKNTLEYREIEHNLDGYYIIQMQSVSDTLYAYEIYKYDYINARFNVYMYYDNLDRSNKIFETSYFAILDEFVSHMNVIDNTLYFGLFENNDLYLYGLYNNGTISKKWLANNLKGRMYLSPYIQCETDTGTEIFSIKNENWYIFNEVITDAAVHLSDSLCFFVGDNGLYSKDLQSKEKKEYSNEVLAYSDNYIIFSDQIWLMNNGKYSIKNANFDSTNIKSFVIDELTVALVYEDRIDIISINK